MTRAEVARLRRTLVGCCSRFADRVPCDCLERAEPSPAPCLTPDDLDVIEAQVHELCDLHGTCAAGALALQLLNEVRYLQARVVELTARLPPLED